MNNNLPNFMRTEHALNERGTRADVKIAVCSSCGTYGLVDTENIKCACEHNHPLAQRDYGCRLGYCKRNGSK